MDQQSVTGLLSVCPTECREPQVLKLGLRLCHRGPDRSWPEEGLEELIEEGERLSSSEGLVWGEESSPPGSLA